MLTACPYHVYQYFLQTEHVFIYFELKRYQDFMLMPSIINILHLEFILVPFTVDISLPKQVINNCASKKVCITGFKSNDNYNPCKNY